MVETSFLKQRAYEVVGIVLVAVGIFLVLSMASFQMEDIPTLTYPPQRPAGNLCGVIGAYTAYGIFQSVGWAGVILPVLFFLWGVNIFRERLMDAPYAQLAGAVVLIGAFACLIELMGEFLPEAWFPAGGWVGRFLVVHIKPFLGVAGSVLVFVALLLVGVCLATGMLLKNIAEVLRNSIGKLAEVAGKVFRPIKKRKEATSTKRTKRQKVSRARKTKEEEEEEETLELFSVEEDVEFKLPPPELLRKSEPAPQLSSRELKEMAEKIEKTLNGFGIEGRVVDVIQGPVVTSFEVEPGAGVKVARITTLADDLALALKVGSIRIVAPIPGKSAIGIEVPNKNRQIVSLREVIESEPFQSSKSKLLLGLGKDIRGDVLVADLSQMPHLLIAGATGSGKTVCLNSIILSILYRATPDEVKFIMIDPKMVELRVYQDIPHLMTPVITEAKLAAAVLKWLTGEMEERFRTLAGAGVKNINDYNRRLAEEGERERMPYLVVIIDELADLMVVSQSVVEDAIMRLAQMARAVGIHLILATQRPSVDVITGVIKANLPYRISFQVSSRVDSRTVLDTIGAEKLIGMGDMLYMPAGATKPIRAQCSFVSDEEIERVVQFIKEQRRPEYVEIKLEEEGTNVQGTSGQGEKDELFEEAVRVVLEAGQASASMLQRRLKIGYARAARLLDQMEQEGIVGPASGSKPRKVLIEPHEWFGDEDEYSG